MFRLSNHTTKACRQREEGSEVRVWDRIASVPGHCLSFYFGQTAIYTSRRRAYGFVQSLWLPSAWPHEKAEEFNGQFTDVFSKNEHTQVPLLDRSAPFMNDIAVSKAGVIKLLKGLNPSKALGPDELILES